MTLYLTEPHSRCHPKVELLDISTKSPEQTKIDVQIRRKKLKRNGCRKPVLNPQGFEWVFYNLPLGELIASAI